MYLHNRARWQIVVHLGVVSRSIALLTECPSSPMFSCVSPVHILPSLANVLLLGLVVVFINVDLSCSFMVIPLLDPSRLKAL